MKRYYKIAVALLSLALASASLAQNFVPANASATYTGGWTCHLGFKLVDDACERVNVPANASATYSGGWTCHLGFRRVDDACSPMSSNEKAAQLATLAAIAASQKREVHNIDGSGFSLRDIERKCEAYVYDDVNGEVECRSGLRPVERKCDVYIFDWPHGELDCRGSE